MSNAGGPWTDDDRLFQITVFRTFSKIATWRTVRDILGRYSTLDDLADGAFTSALDQARRRNGGPHVPARPARRERERVHPGRAGRAARHQEVLRRHGRLHPGRY